MSSYYCSSQLFRLELFWYLWYWRSFDVFFDEYFDVFFDEYFEEFFDKCIDEFENLSFFWNRPFWILFFASFTWKSVKLYWVFTKDGSKFWWLSWFPAQNYSCVNISNTVYSPTKYPQLLTLQVSYSYNTSVIFILYWYE